MTFCLCRYHHLPDTRYRRPGADRYSQNVGLPLLELLYQLNATDYQPD
jgi:hypothetical protein